MKVILLAFVFSLSGYAAKEKFRDDQMLRDLHSTYWESWNRHDTKALAGSFVDDASLVSVQGKRANDRDAIEKLLVEEHQGAMKETQAHGSQLAIQFVNRNVAVIDEEVEFQGIKGKKEPQRFSVTTIAIKKAGKWLIAAFRSRQIPSSP